MRLHNEFVTI